MRFLLYSHDGLGLGHVRRNLAIAAALVDAAPDACVLLATGADEVNSLGVSPQVEVLKLPGLRKVANERYAARRLQILSADIWRLRTDLLTTTARSYCPDVILADKHPLGAGGELVGALETLKRSGGRAVLGLRDILDDPATVRREWDAHGLRARIEAYYARVIVYGQRAVLDPVQEYQFSAALAERTHFCGYVLNPHNPTAPSSDYPLALTGSQRTRPVVLATAGGGEDGFSMLSNFIRAAVGAPWDGVVVAGPRASAGERAALEKLATDAGVAFNAFVPGVARWFDLVDAVVCMGGYNTLAEVLSRGCTTVCVPRTVPRTEQLIRARAFARLGLLRVVEPDQFDGDTLGREIGTALGESRAAVLGRTEAALDFDGARRAASALIDVAQPSRLDQPVAVSVLAS